MVIYIASGFPLPLIPWQADVPAFNVAELIEREKPVLRHFTLPYVCLAGSHTSCGCGFSEGRAYRETYDDPSTESAAALESSLRLARYVREHRVEQIYSCWDGDDGEPQEFERHIGPDDLAAPDFFFRERELLFVDL